MINRGMEMDSENIVNYARANKLMSCLLTRNENARLDIIPISGKSTVY